MLKMMDTVGTPDWGHTRNLQKEEEKPRFIIAISMGKMTISIGYSMMYWLIPHYASGQEQLFFSDGGDWPCEGLRDWEAPNTEKESGTNTSLGRF